MYHVIGTGLTAIILYLLSYFFYRTGFYSVQIHRKFWNSILAITFLVTALAGLFLALQITYKWNIPIIKSVLRWHVECGAGLATIGLFHLLWHLSYFKRLFEKQYKPLSDSVSWKNGSTDIALNLFVIGFVSSSFQLLLIKEMMNISGGYELITGTFLGSWLIGSAAGAAIAGKSNLNDLKKINLIFSASPLFSVFLLILLSRLFLETGETPSFLESMIFTFLVLIPFCIVSGFTFIKLISAAATEKKYVPGKSFSLETTGGIVAGIMISVLSAGFLNTYQMILLLITSALSYVILSFIVKIAIFKVITRILLFIVFIILIISNPDILFRSLLLPGINITGTKETPYGNITTGEYSGEQSVYYNQRLLSYHDDVIEREENIHYAMLQSTEPEQVLLISGSINSHIPEIFKYPVKEIVYVERDPALIRIEQGFAEKYKDLHIENNDAFRYMRNTEKMFDVIILLLPPPSSLLLNKYYTAEFFNIVSKRLNSGGIFMCSPGISADYLNKESVKLYSSIYNSLSDTFKNIIPVEGHKLYFIASDHTLSTSFCELAEMKKIKNIYVSQDFLADDLIKSKSEEILSLMDSSISKNRSVYPIACFFYQSYNLSKSLHEKTPAIVLMIVLFALPAILIKRRNILMYASASALAGFEIIVLLMLQLTAGNMYQLTGLIIAGLMTGLAIGSGISLRILNSLTLRIKSIVLVLFYLATGLLANPITEMRSAFLVTILLVSITFIPSIITGHMFRILTLGPENNPDSSAVYSADLAGSALGFILISGLIIPTLGIRSSIFILAALVFTGFLSCSTGNKH
jgi:spermidine synthase